ncbi:S41 family peptidase [Bacillus sp. ISL-45]|uniref:lmo1851 family serine protease n=1 Tax=Bacillus sp. ISL-45 TaxID=2819128 RepID=UPI001BE8BD9B|nr:S41 family peptidase [Bacillus sp. ISL-45]MBT2662470.1 S41 family peptidase [Bacillus sp. ISL-45]
MNEENKEELEGQNKATETETKNSFLRIKKFHFAMLLFFLVFLTAGITTFALAFGEDKPAVQVIREREEFAKLYDAYDTLKNDYFEEVDQEKLINGAIDGMLESLDDPYSDYMSQEDAKNFHQSLSSSFEGIGAEIQERDGFIFIVTPLKGSPAEKAGLQPEDKIMSVDGKSVQGMSTTEAVALIRGEKGTDVKLSILRQGGEKPVDVTITRDTIPIETVYGEMLDDGVAKVQITNFSQNTANELVNILNDLQKQGMKGLVLDLRQNPGGLLDQAIKISSLFVPEGEILFQVEDRAGNVKKYASENENKNNLPLVVIIDKGSASASEILAGAVSESAGVPLVGEKSFGKGTVQRAEDFSDGSNMKLTTEKWLTPEGNWIHKKGIKPDHEVSMPEYASLPFIDPETELKESTASEQVKAAQKMLKALGFDPGREDGFYDEKTKEAVIAFQKSKELEETGILKGSSTIELMNALREQIKNEDPQIQKAIEVLKQEMNK